MTDKTVNVKFKFDFDAAGATPPPAVLPPPYGVAGYNTRAFGAGSAGPYTAPKPEWFAQQNAASGSAALPLAPAATPRYEGPDPFNYSPHRTKAAQPKYTYGSADDRGPGRNGTYSFAATQGPTDDRLKTAADRADRDRQDGDRLAQYGQESLREKSIRDRNQQLKNNAADERGADRTATAGYASTLKDKAQGTAAAQLSRFGDVLESGATKLLGFAGAVIGAYHVITAFGSHLGRLADQTNSPFLTGVERDRSTPIFGTIQNAAGGYHKFGEAVGARMAGIKSETQQATEGAIIYDAQFKNQAQAQAAGRHNTDEELRRKFRAEKAKDFKLPELYDGFSPADLDRSTVTGANRYRDELAELPAKQRQAHLDLAVQNAAEDVKIAENREKSLTDKMKESQKHGEDLQARRDTLSGNIGKSKPGTETIGVAIGSAVMPMFGDRIAGNLRGGKDDELYRERASNADKAAVLEFEKYKALNEERKANADKLTAAQDAQAQAQAAQRTGMKDRMSARLGRLGEREQEASGQAHRLGAMGIDGRMEAQMAFQVFQQMGPQNATSDLISRARGHAPEEVDRMLEEAGSPFAKQYRESGRKEYRDDLPKIRETQEQLRKDIGGLDETNVKKLSDMMAEIFKDRDVKIMKMFADVIGNLRKQLESEANIGANQ